MNAAASINDLILRMVLNMNGSMYVEISEDIKGGMYRYFIYSNKPITQKIFFIKSACGLNERSGGKMKS